MRSCAWPAISAPWSQVSDRRSWPGRAVIVEAIASPTASAPLPAGAQTRGQLTPQRPAALDVQGLVDRLVRDPHRFIIREVDPEPVRDLLRAPRCCPAPVGPASMVSPDPPHIRAPHSFTIWPGD